MINKRTLIISNNALSGSSSNGRTLKNFFGASDKPFLAQFYIQSGDVPDFDVCERYFTVSDRDVLTHFVKHISVGQVVCPICNVSQSTQQSRRGRKIGRNPLTMLLRNFLWNRKSWQKLFLTWIDDFLPERVLLQAGDSPFMYDLAVEIANRYQVPLLIYNSEEYYFKNYNYFINSGLTGIFYPLFHKKLCTSVKKAIARSSVSVYINEQLKQLYDREFDASCISIYTGTDVKPVNPNHVNSKFSYLGNLGLGRHIGLIEIAETLRRLNEGYTLDVYGKIPSEDVLHAFRKCPAINYCGVISYSEVKQVIAQSLLIFHVESFAKFYVRDIQYGFSTKIADCLASGVCFVMYAPDVIAGLKYVNDHDCACVITGKEKLEDSLRKIIADEGLRAKYIHNALQIAKKNHSIIKNRRMFAEVVNGNHISDENSTN